MASPAVPMASLMAKLELPLCECLNENSQHTLQEFLKDPEDNRMLMSDHDDPQLLIKLGFSNPAKMSAINLKSPEGSVQAGEAPTKVRIFINDLSMSFADAESEIPMDEFDIPAGKIEAGVSLPLKVVKYQKVCSLVVFVEDNGGGAVTKISKLDVLGIPTAGLEMKDWKPLKPEEMLAPNDT